MVDIFTRAGGESVWIETVDNRAAALGRLIVLCAEKPGEYFAVCGAEIVSEVSSCDPSIPSDTQLKLGGV